MKKRILAFLLAICICSAVSLPVYAQAPEQPQTVSGEGSLLRWSHFMTITNTLSINSSGTATITVLARASSPINYVSVSSKLQRNVSGSWVTVETYSNSSSNVYVTMSKTKTRLTKGYNYRLQSTFTAKYNGTTYETVTVTDSYYY